MTTPAEEVAHLRRLLEEVTERLTRLESQISSAPLEHLPPAPTPDDSSAPMASPEPTVRASHEVPSPTFESSPPPLHPPQEDLESKIGGNVLNKVGFTAVLFGVAYFLRYAFESGWIGPVGKIVSGLAAGVVAIISSEAILRRGHRRFSHSVAMLGVGILYLTTWAATEMYQLVSQPTGFVAMVLITTATVYLSLRRNQELLAGLALFGGFLTPALLSTGENRPLQLFAYLLILDGAAVVVVARRGWIRLLVLSFTATAILYVSWFSRYYDAGQLFLASCFIVVITILFALTPLVGEARSAPSRSLLAFGNAMFLLAQMFAMYEGTTARVLVLLLIGAFYLSLFLIFREERSGLAILHLSIAIFALSLAAPIAMDEEWVSLAWLLEGAVLLLAGSRVERAAGVLGSFVFAVGVFHLVFIARFDAGMPVLNMRVADFLVAIFVLTVLAFRSSDEAWRRFAVVSANVLALIMLNGEIRRYFEALPSERLARDFTYSAVWLVYGALLMIWGFRRSSKLVRWLALALIGVTVAKVFFYDLSQLDRLYRIFSFIGLGGVLLGISYAYQKKWLEPILERPRQSS